MKIVVVIDIYDLMTNGTVMTAYRFVEELRKKGHEVRVVGTGAKGPDCYEVPERYIPLVTEVARLQQIRFGKPDIDVLTNAFSGADLIHFYLPFKLEKNGKKIADRMGIPTTAAFHLQPENCTYNSGLKYSKLAPKILYATFRMSFFRKFDHIHCPSKFIAGQLKQHKYLAKTHVISNGVDKDFVAPAQPKPLDKEKINILMIGRYANEKRQDVLIKACGLSKYADKIHLTLAGKGPNQNSLKRLAAKKLKNPITFGFYNKEELINVIHNSDLYVHAADVEIEAIACIEAFACGLVPIIANSNKSATPQFAIDERSLFKAGSAKDLAEKIDYLIDNNEQREELSKKYIEQGEKYSIEYSIQKAEEMFKEAISTFKEKKKLSTKEAQKRAKHYSKRSRIFRFFSWIFYYIIAAPILTLATKTHFGLKVRGRKNLRKVRKKGYVSVSNHVHLLDCAMNAVAMFPRKVVFTAMESNFKIPVAGGILKLMGGIPVPSDFTELKFFMSEISRLLKACKRNVHIYAEGHLINYYAGIRELNRGAFRIACQNQTPIIPMVTSWRERKGLHKLAFTKKPCATITIGEPIYPDDCLLRKEMELDLANRVFAKMQELYAQSNGGNSINYYHGKEAPKEFMLNRGNDKPVVGESQPEYNLSVSEKDAKANKKIAPKGKISLKNLFKKSEKNSQVVENKNQENLTLDNSNDGEQEKNTVITSDSGTLEDNK